MGTETTAMEKKGTEAGVLGNLPCNLSQFSGRLHFIGIGGIGMSALARLALDRGINVSGSDKQGNKITEELSRLGAHIYTGHNASNVQGASGIVVSTAITTDNPELSWARANDLPVWHRSEVLAALGKDKKLVAICGTHGKTTTTGMIGKLFIDNELDPSIVVGGVLPLLKSNCRVGKGEYFIAEADESDGTHLSLPASIAIITNIEADHLENYTNGLKGILDTMQLFANKAKTVIICADDQGCRQIIPGIKGKIITYRKKGSAKPDNSLEDYEFETIDAGMGMTVYRNGKLLGTINLSVPGLHNQYNALAAIAVGIECGLSFDNISSSLAQFGGVERRFQIIGQAKDILVVDDYAHHPTEVEATLQAAKQYIAQNKFAGKRVVAVFQPHQPGRLKDFWNEFCQAFKNCDLLLVTDVYIARGGAIEGINSERFAKEVKQSNCHYLPGSTSTLAEQIKAFLKTDDLVITIGAGDITTVGPQLLQVLRS